MTSLIRFTRIATICIWQFSGICARTLAAQEPVPQVAARQPEALVLGPEDQISVHVADFDEIPGTAIQVDSTGFVVVPMLGRFQASGLTVVDLEREIAKRVSRFVKEPQVSVAVVSLSSQPVSIIGAVNKPGVYQIAGPKTLVEVVSLAGGLRPDAGSTLRITREVANGHLSYPGKRADLSGKYEVAEVDLDDLMKAKIPAANMSVEAHDVISVPKADLVYIVGSVRRPGGFPISSHDSTSVLQGLALAEGLGPTAAPKSARILRPAADGQERREIPVNISDVLAGKTSDVALQSNDVLFVPTNSARSIGMRAAEVALQIGTGIVIYRH